MLGRLSGVLVGRVLQHRQRLREVVTLVQQIAIGCFGVDVRRVGLQRSIEQLDRLIELLLTGEHLRLHRQRTAELTRRQV